MQTFVARGAVPSVREVLHGHTSPETAYVVDDYPYGFRLRCKIRYWIETKPGKGQRLVSQTTNPKIAGREVWNKPKASTYSDVKILYLDGDGHVQSWGIGDSSWAESFAAVARHLGTHLDADEMRRIVEAERRARKLNAFVAARYGHAESSFEEWDRKNPDNLTLLRVLEGPVAPVAAAV